MKISKLILERYGPFSGRTFEFDTSAKLHVIYGPNEAGKTCALAAITDLLFGVNPRTAYDFQHAGKDLRIGATLRARSGTELNFRRRKGNKNTLLEAAADNPLSDDVLSPYLGGINRDVFCSAFGLNAETLRHGAEEMLKSEGEVGASLFAAASGLRGLTELRKHLEAEADSIFTSRQSKERQFYQALHRFDNARRAVREQELKAGDWKQLNDKIDELKLQQSQIQEQRASNKTEWALWTRLKRVAPQIRLIDEELKKLESLGTLPSVPKGFPAKLSVALSTLGAAIEKQVRGDADLKAAADSLADIMVDEVMLTRADEISRLFSETGAINKAREDLPRIQIELDDLAADIRELAARLGNSDPDTVQKGRPTDAAQALVQSLIDERTKIDGKAQTVADALSDEQVALEELERRKEDAKNPTDPGPLQDRYRAQMPVLKKLEKHEVDTAQIPMLVRSLAESARRLSPAIEDLDTLATVSLPGTETVARFRKTLDEIERRLDFEKGRLTDATQSVAQTEISLGKADVALPVPSPEAISAERQQRDHSWVLLRGTLFGGPSALTGAALGAAVSAFERQTAKADRLADEALRDRDRVAQHAAQQMQLADAQKKMGEAETAVREVEDEYHRQTGAWHAIWSDAGIVPLRPGEMASWLEYLHRLLQRREELETSRSSVNGTANEIKGIEPVLLQLMKDANLETATPFSTASGAALLQDRLRDMTDAWNQTRDVETR